MIPGGRCEPNGVAELPCPRAVVLGEVLHLGLLLRLVELSIFQRQVGDQKPRFTVWNVDRLSGPDDGGRLAG